MYNVAMKIHINHVNLYSNPLYLELCNLYGNKVIGTFLSIFWLLCIPFVRCTGFLFPLLRSFIFFL